MDKAKRAEQLSEQILKYSRNELLVSLRFMDLALCKLEYRMDDVQRTATDGKYLYYNPKHIFKLYEAGSGELNHSHLHTIFHCIFYHPFVNKKIDRPLWDIACDIAVEGIISEFNMKQLDCSNTILIDHELANMKSKYGKLTAEKLYREFSKSKIDASEILRLRKIFSFDDHNVWYADGESSSQSANNSQQGSGEAEEDQNAEHASVSAAADPAGNRQSSDLEAEWKEISERVKVDLETSSKEWGDRSSNLMQNITEVNRETYDYADFLQKFAVMGEEMRINDDEFDYIFYTYGLQLYGNVPLVEPLEYKDVKKVKEFVIAIDTSGSCSSDTVRRFMEETYGILSDQENFFRKMNLYIIQCDCFVQDVAHIICEKDWKDYLKNLRIHGRSGTDFRPVFDYIEKLRSERKLKNLKGLLYFTDGDGIYPEKPTDYETAFVFYKEKALHQKVPAWAVRLYLDTEKS